MWTGKTPAIIDELEGEWIIKDKVFQPWQYPGVTFRIITSFYDDNKNSKTLNRYVKNNKDIFVLIGDYTVTGPFSPFSEFPKLQKVLNQNKNVYFINSPNDEKNIKSDF